MRIRVYNASNRDHSMHLHGHDFTVTSRNGHPIAPEDRNEITTQIIGPGDFFEMEFVADNPGTGSSTAMCPTTPPTVPPRATTGRQWE